MWEISKPPGASTVNTLLSLNSFLNYLAKESAFELTNQTMKLVSA